MKPAEKKIEYIPNNGECYRVLDDKAYFSINGTHGIEYAYFQFESKSKAKEFKNNRSFKNTVKKLKEDFMFCDDKGNFSHSKYYKLLKSYGEQPNSPKNLMELWAIREVFGLYLDLDDEQEIDLLLMNVNSDKGNTELCKDKEHRKQDINNRLKQLCDRFKVDYIFANIFLDDIKARYLRTKQLDEEVNIAIILGLINKE